MNAYKLLIFAIKMPIVPILKEVIPANAGTVILVMVNITVQVLQIYRFTMKVELAKSLAVFSNFLFTCSSMQILMSALLTMCAFKTVNAQTL